MEFIVLALILFSATLFAIWYGKYECEDKHELCVVSITSVVLAFVLLLIYQ